MMDAWLLIAAITTCSGSGSAGCPERTETRVEWYLNETFCRRQGEAYAKLETLPGKDAARFRGIRVAWKCELVGRSH